MPKQDAIVAIYHDHTCAEDAVRRLVAAGTPPHSISIIGKGYHTDEKVTGFYNAGDRIKFWGRYGAFWGGLWGLLLGGVFMTVPLVGPVVILGHLGTMAAGALTGAATFGTVGALGAALVSLGIPKDSVIKYEEAVKADKFLVIVNGPAADVAAAKAQLGDSSKCHIHHHENLPAATPGAAS